MTMSMRLAALVFLSLFASFGAAQVASGQIDDFQDGTTMSWSGGANPANVPSGGPAGTDDKYLSLTSGVNGKIATYNITRWGGNYTTAGVGRIEADLKNLGDTELYVRVVLHGTNGTRWSSKTPFVLPVGGAWSHHGVDLVASNFTITQGVGTFAETLASLDRLMFRHEVIISAGGSVVTGSLGIDNVKGINPNDFSFALNKTQVAGQNSVKGTVTLANTPPQNVVFTTFDNSSLVTTPASVTVTANTTTKDFQITVSAVNSAINTTVSAKLGPVTKTAPLTLVPLIPTALAFTPNPVVGGNSVSCRVVINGVAGPGGRTIAVFDNSTYTTMPSSVVVPAGATQVFFTINTTHPNTVQTVTVTARVSAGEKTANFRINP